MTWSLLAPGIDHSHATAHASHCLSGPRLQAWPACFYFPSFAHISPTDQAVHPSLIFTLVLQELAQGHFGWLELAPSSVCQYCVRDKQVLESQDVGSNPGSGFRQVSETQFLQL